MMMIVAPLAFEGGVEVEETQDRILTQPIEHTHKISHSRIS